MTPDEKARIAGGFGATDESIANLLQQAVQRDMLENKPLHDSGHNLQDLVNEGLSFALRANDYHTSRQLLVLYTLIASKGQRRNSDSRRLLGTDEGYQSDTSKASGSSKNWRDVEKDMEKNGDNERNLFRDERSLGKDYIPRPPPPPPLDTDR